MSARKRSRSPHAERHRCSIGVTTSEKEEIEATKIIRKDWYGNGKSVPVKDSVDAALQAHVDATGEMPDYILTFNIPLGKYHKWTHDGTMIRVEYLSGYRIKSGITEPPQQRASKQRF